MRVFRRIPVVAAALLAACGFASQPLSEERTQEIANEVQVAQAALLDAARRADAEAMTPIFADEGRFLFNGVARSNADALDFVRQVYAVIDSQEIEIADERITVLGPDAAVVTGNGRVTAVDTAGARGEPAEFAWTFTWARQDGAWRVVDSHQSVVRPGDRP